MSLTLIVTGGRDWRDSGYVFRVLTQIDEKEGIAEIVEGGATGVDSYARNWARQNKVPHRTFEANWKTHGLAAGPIRNEQMANYALGKDFRKCVVFPGGRGTANMRKNAEKLGIEIIDASTL